MKRISWAPALLVLASCSEPSPFALKDVGSFHVGGRAVETRGESAPQLEFTPGIPANVDPNGTHHVEQMYVQYFIPAQQRGRYPLLLWHGAWLTGATWETTPDGREGWLHYFLKRGWATYNSDAVERGRAGWAPFPDVFPGEPLFLTKENAFERFRIGDGPGSWNADPAKRKILPGNLFPVEAFDQFTMQAVPRWTVNNQATIAAYIELVDKVCPCVVMVHSQSGLFGASVAEARPDKVKALVMIEPGNGGTREGAARLKNTPVLAVWGDFVAQDARWSRIRETGLAYFEAVRAGGGLVDVIDLPDAGVHGNSHMIMMDRNSNQVAGLVQEWLEQRGMYE